MIPLSPQLDSTWPPHACLALKKAGVVCPQRFSERILGDAEPLAQWTKEMGGARMASQRMGEIVTVLEEMASQHATRGFRDIVAAYWMAPLCRLYPDPVDHFVRQGEVDLVLDILRQGLDR